ncbi:hypothetical protein F2Q69_00054723 [Brassica cretica]|uniref:Uncharacterized protein n=1 Tax=Brassica cretica TaxID=69181 RepID=A0A8S9MZB7_BRACR|nr:hypothetical protein F2Q69_00054723 [Brassica cretica]
MVVNLRRSRRSGRFTRAGSSNHPPGGSASPAEAVAAPSLGDSFALSAVMNPDNFQEVTQLFASYGVWDMDLHHVAKEIGWFLVLTCVVHSCSEVIDPAAIFSMLYGSEHFEEYIGQLDVVSMASLDILSERDQTDTKMIIEKMRAVEKKRKRREACTNS